MATKLQKPLEILIVGTGAVGTVFGARAQKIHSKVTAVCRSNYEVVKSSGIGIKSTLWGDSVFRPDRVVRTPSDVSHVDFDYVVLATKSSNHATDPIVDSIHPVVNRKTTLVSVQNGVTSETALRLAYENPIVSSTCYISCLQKRPGMVEQASHVRPHAFYLGINRPGRFSDGKQELNTLVGLDHAFSQVSDAQSERWRKMIFNTAWSLSAALMDKNTHEILRDNGGVQLAMSLAQEAHRIGRSMGVELAADLPELTIESARRAPPLVPSMLRDIRSGKPIEVEALCGGLLHIAQQEKLDTPILNLMYQFLTRINRDLESRQTRPLSMSQVQTLLTLPTAVLNEVHAVN